MPNNRNTIISWSIVASVLIFCAPLWFGDEHRCPVAPTHRSGDTEALPAFARKYNADCTLCHTVWPRLNRTGYIFRRLGYRMPYEVDEQKPSKQGTNPSTRVPPLTQQPSAEAAPIAPGDLTIGKNEFEKAGCNMCHVGGGNVIDASKPLKGAGFLKKYPDDAQIARVIRQGVAGTAMPAYGENRLSADQVRNIIAYIRSITPPQ